ncbi:DUF2972 domain-containing protein, partial [Campylobacter sp.]|uniref:DUF2972 domain-containing protein n=1 Tax=Campylobacter sp. TaxID=205 RepID=UPI0026DD666C
PDVLNALLEGENSGAAAGRNSCGAEQVGGAGFAAECAAYAREGLTYRTLGAEVAWALNLPLPRRYGFVLFFNPCSSSEALHFFFRLCGLKVGIWGIGGWGTYERNYQNALSGKAALATLCPISKLEPYRKHCYLMDGGFSLVLAVRDPISSLKSYCNHIHNVFTAQNITARMREFRAYDEEFIFPEIFYCTEKDPKDRRPSVDALAYLAQDVESFYSLDEILDICADSVREVVVLDFHRDLAFGACFESFRALSQRLGFAPPEEGLGFAFEKKVNLYDGLNHLPVRLGFEGFELWVSVPYITHDLRAWRNVTPELFGAEFVLENVFVLIERGAAQDFLAHENFKKMRGYVAAYIEALGRYVEGVRARLLGEGDVLEFLASNPAAALKLREAIERNFKRVKAERPDIVASWKYYAEFERICAGFGGG